MHSSFHHSESHSGSTAFPSEGSDEPQPFHFGGPVPAATFPLTHDDEEALGNEPGQHPSNHAVNRQYFDHFPSEHEPEIDLLNRRFRGHSVSDGFEPGSSPTLLAHEVARSRKSLHLRDGKEEDTVPKKDEKERASSIKYHTDQSIVDESIEVCGMIEEAKQLRQKYLAASFQRPEDDPRSESGWRIYPPPPPTVWNEHGQRSTRDLHGTPSIAERTRYAAERKEKPLDPRYRKGGGEQIGNDFDFASQLPVPARTSALFALDETSVYQVYASQDDLEARRPTARVPRIQDYFRDLTRLSEIANHGPVKSFAFKRLEYLQASFQLYALMNERSEQADSKKVPHRDFYNVRKVDTHVHHSASMNQKHLLRFIKSKLKKAPNDVVIHRDGVEQTLQQVFDSIQLTAFDLSIDTLDMHAHKDSFHRFDKFNLKYNPIGESRLREIFLKTDNHIGGRYLAELTKEIFSDLEASKYHMAEYRVSIYGRSPDEWDKLAAWIIDHKLYSHNVRWLIQVPRLYQAYRAAGQVRCFQDMIVNIFRPLFEVTQDPSSHPKLHIFLQRVIGFDTVDDESKQEIRLYKRFPWPKDWNTSQNPPYSYWIYYLYANLASLNAWRNRLSYSTFVLRPHCGEAGDPEHLTAATLCCHSISHGILLRKMSCLQYIFYLEQIGIAMSPLSNNALYLPLNRNPFPLFFKKGLNVSLSTDDPLQFAFTREPLIEEYSVATQIYRLSAADMCELARNSVLQSGFEHEMKQRWLGPEYKMEGVRGNRMTKSNVPDRRVHYRHTTWKKEVEMVRNLATGLGASDVVETIDTLDGSVLSLVDSRSQPPSTLGRELSEADLLYMRSLSSRLDGQRDAVNAREAGSTESGADGGHAGTKDMNDPDHGLTESPRGMHRRGHSKNTPSWSSKLASVGEQHHQE